jgi:hypothetical protein
MDLNMTFKLQIKLLFIIVFLSGCGISPIKGYPEQLNVQEEKLATVTLKSPVISRFPLFWLFPFNMLAWVYDDWFETAWGDGIDIKTQFKELHTIRLTRFKAVKVLPGLLEAVSSSLQVIDSKRNPDINGTCTFSTQSCTCPEQNDSKKDQNKQQEKSCSQSVTKCETPYIYTGQNRDCLVSFSAEAGRYYQIFRRDEKLFVQENGVPTLVQGMCNSSDPYTFTGTETTEEKGVCS